MPGMCRRPFQQRFVLGFSITKHANQRPRETWPSETYDLATAIMTTRQDNGHTMKLVFIHEGDWTACLETDTKDDL